MTKEYYFNLVSGAFDSSAKNTSFSGILLMFKNLIHIFLSLPDEEFKFFNQKLLQDVGVENLELLNELIPDLSLLTNISKDTSKSFCNLIDKEKFTEALISLLKVAANENSPLVIHFDSIETADHDSIVFIERVLRDNSIHHLLVIATSRLSENNDIQNELLFQIFKVKSGETNSPLITRIILENLTANDVLTVISRTLCPLAENHADLKVLASITLSKTLGNPYHLREFLLLAEKNGFIYLDRKRAGWNWDIKGIENGMSISDNVLTLLSSRLKNLSAECMKIIKISACLGSKFEYSALKVISNESEGFIDEHLSILTSEGLISSTHKLSKQFRRLSVSSATPSVLRRGSIKSDYYNGSNTGSKEKFDAGSGTLNKLTETYKIEFRHERVRIAVLEYLSKEEEITIHYKIALMIASRQLDTSETPIEDAEHFNIASSMFSSNEEFFYAACLNYNASVEAKKNFSLILSKKLIYESLAFSERIEKDTSEFNFELDQLKYKIYKILAAAFETDGEYVEAENIYRKCLSLDISESEKVQVIQNLIDNFSLQFNSKKSFELIMEQLAYFGIEILSQNERIAYVQTEFKRLDEFLNQPLDTLISENRPAPSEISNCRQTLLFIASSTNESLGNYEMSDYLIIKCCILALEEGVGKRAALCFSCVSRVYYNLSITSKPDISKISKLYNIANNLIQSSSIEDKIAACYLQFDFGQSFLMSDKNVTLRNCVSLSKQSESNRYLKTAPYCLLICQVQHGQSILHLRDTLKLQPALANLKTEEHLKNAIDLLLEHLEALFQGNKLAETSPALPRSFRNDIELIRFISATIFERPEAGQLCKELNDIMSTQKSYSSYITVSVLTVRNLAIQFSNISIGSMSQQNKTAKPTALGISSIVSLI